MPARFTKLFIRLHDDLLARLDAAAESQPFQLQRAAVIRAALDRGLDITEHDPSARPPRHREGKGKALAVPLEPAQVARVDALAARLSPGFRISRSEIVRGCVALGLPHVAGPGRAT